MIKKITIKKRYIPLIIITVLFIRQKAYDFSLKSSNNIFYPKEFDILQLLPTDFGSSNVVYNDKNGKITRIINLKPSDVISFSYLIQNENKVYFTNNSGGAKSIMSYDYEKKQLSNELEFLEGGYFESYNPYSQLPIITINGGFGSDINKYATGVCIYINDNWKCHNMYDRFEIGYGIVFNDKIYLYLADGQENFDKDQLAVYDFDFNEIKRVNLIEKYNISDSSMKMISYKNNIYIISLEDGQALKIVQIDKDLMMIKEKTITETSSCINSDQASLFKNNNDLYIELFCSTANPMKPFDISTSLIKIDLDTIEKKANLLSLDNGSVSGIDFTKGFIFSQTRTPSAEKVNVSVYDLNYNFLKDISFDKHKKTMPMVIDINENLIRNK